MAKRTPEQLTALFTEMGEAEVAKALSSHKWRTKAYNTLALEWLTKARTEKPLVRTQSPAKAPVYPEVAGDKPKAMEKHTDASSDKSDKKPHNTHTPNKPKGAK